MESTEKEKKRNGSREREKQKRKMKTLHETEKRACFGLKRYKENMEANFSC